MKKRIVMGLMIGALSLSLFACGKKADDTTDKSANSAKTDVIAEDNALENDNEEKELTYEDMTKLMFDFSSGVGGWGTELQISSDGSFVGSYHDSELGDLDETSYPNGTIYLNEFSGKFGELEKMSDYIYKTTLDEISYDHEIDTEEIDESEGVRYVYAEGYGLEDAKDIYFYMPGCPVEDLPEDYIGWMRSKGALGEDDTTLPFMGLYNETPGNGFSSSETED